MSDESLIKAAHKRKMSSYLIKLIVFVGALIVLAAFLIPLALSSETPPATVSAVYGTQVHSTEMILK